MECSGIQDIYASIDLGVSSALLYIYIWSVVVYKASVIDWQGGSIWLSYIYIYIYIYIAYAV